MPDVHEESNDGRQESNGGHHQASEKNATKVRSGVSEAASTTDEMLPHHSKQEMTTTTPKQATDQRYVIITLGSRLDPASHVASTTHPTDFGLDDGREDSFAMTTGHHHRQGTDPNVISSDDVTVACKKCGAGLKSREAIFAMGAWWHPHHFECRQCKSPFMHHQEDAGGRDSRFDSASGAVMEAAAAAAMRITQHQQEQEDPAYHLHPSQAVECPDCEYFERDGYSFCRHCYLGIYGRSVCAGCLHPLQRGQQVLSAMDLRFHTQCFNCAKCQERIEPTSNFFNCDDKPLCEGCYIGEFKTCPGCHSIVEVLLPFP